MDRKPKSRLPASYAPKSPILMAQISETADQIAAEAAKTIESSDFRDQMINPEAKSRSDRLREAVRLVGGNKAVAAAARVPVSTLGDYIAGGEWKFSSAMALARACGVSLDWLADGEGPPIPPTAKLSVPALSPEPDLRHDLTTEGFAVVPRYDVRASAGRGSLVEREELIGYLALEENFVRLTLHRRREDLVSIEATGDSMEPAIHDGDLLVVDVSVQDVQNSRIYVLNINGELLVKRLSLRLDGSVVVRSDNPKYETEVVVPSERNSLRIIGQVIYQAGPVRS